MSDEGKKHDAGKLPHHLLPFDAVNDISEVLQFGMEKYGPRNWELGMEWSRPFSAMMRHMWAWWMGQDNDDETGLSHLSHAACCLIFLMAYSKRGKGTDDRPGV